MQKNLFILFLFLILIIIPSVTASHFTGSFSDAGKDTGTDGLFDYLTITAGVYIDDANKDYMLASILEDSEGNSIEYHIPCVSLPFGHYNFTMDFDGIKLYRNKVNGPYNLKYIWLSSVASCQSEPPDIPTIEDSLFNAYNTAFYDYTQFQTGEPAIYCNDSPCIASSALIKSRDNLNIPELNAPNTLDGCEDGTSGTYLSTESIESITITSLNHSFFKIGDTVDVEINVYCDSLYDKLNFIYTNDIDSIQWEVKANTQCTSEDSMQTLSSTFALDNNIGQHAIRGVFGFNILSGTICGEDDPQNNWADTDDVVIYVKECNNNDHCEATECDQLDSSDVGCYSGTHRDYHDMQNTCSQGYTCTQYGCTNYNEIITDNDGDGYDTECDNDCNDTNEDIHPGATEACNGIDDNCDTIIPSNENNNDGDSYRICEGDCNDANPSVYPGATEVCNGLDDDCDGTTDEENAQGCTTYYRDNDNDSYGQSGNSKCLCSPQSPYDTIQKNDCNDNNPNVNPAATEICNNGIDDDCDTLFDSDDPDCFECAPEAKRNCPKQNGVCSGSEETCTSQGQWPGCNDAAYLSHNSNYQNPETSCDGLDNDCDTLTDEGLKTTYYQDTDSDSYGNPAVSQNACTQPSGYITNNTDCNDTNSNVNPAATENCSNGIDDNCDGDIDMDDAACQGKYEINLTEGWNLMSLPKIDNNSIEEAAQVFNDNFGKIIALKQGIWYVYDRLNPGNSNLDHLSEADGFWIEANNNFSVLIDDEAVAQASFNLTKGWNLIGYPSLEEKNVTKLFENVIDNVELIYIYNPDFKSFNPKRPVNFMIKPGRGIFIKVKNNASWFFDGTYKKEEESFTLGMDNGWNIISVPLTSDKTISELFGSTTTYYLENNKWKQLGGNNQINYSHSYWIKSDGNAVIVNGTPISSLNFDISQGWNLINYPLRYETNVELFFNNVLNNIESIMIFEDGTWKRFSPEKPNNSLTTLKPGKGIFIKAKNNAQWNFNGNELVATLK
ncbi:MAG: putative metal-binding motif-containing protein [Nanoarchaeota archaeon]|nr:putative metal-binding motif-containing protein [Nanoarchaeota archaeon]